MKSNIRTLLTLLLTLGCLLLLVACGGTDDETTVPSTTTARGGTTTAPAVTTAPPTGTTTAIGTTAAPLTTTEPDVTAPPILTRPTAPATTAPITTPPVTTAPPVTEFDYTQDLSGYLTIPREDYYGAGVTIPAVDEITDGDVESFIFALLSPYAKNEPLTDGEIAKGDTVTIFYRGQIEIDGKWVDFLGGSNLTSTAYALTIGSKSFIDGFEDALIGYRLEDSELLLFSDRDKIVGEVGEPIVYVSYTCSYVDANGKTQSGTLRDRIDLHRDPEGSFTVPGRYDGCALREDILGKHIGTVLDGTYTASFDVTGDLEPETVTITNVKITHIVDRETTFGEMGYFEVAFPEVYPNNEALAGKTARWYVSAVSATRPVLPEITYEFLTGDFGLTVEEITPFIPEDATGTTEEKIVAAFPLYIRSYLEEERENEIYMSALSALFEALAESVTVTEYPAALLEAQLAELRASAEESYRQYVASYGASYYPTLADYMLDYFGEEYFPSGKDSIDEGLDTIAKEQIEHQLILHYMANAEGWNLTLEESTVGYEERVRLMLDYYNSYYGVAGTPYEFTVEDLEAAGYTRDVILNDLFLEKVYDALYEAMKDNIVFE